MKIHICREQTPPLTDQDKEALGSAFEFLLAEGQMNDFVFWKNGDHAFHVLWSIDAHTNEKDLLLCHCPISHLKESITDNLTDSNLVAITLSDHGDKILLIWDQCPNPMFPQLEIVFS